MVLGSPGDIEGCMKEGWCVTIVNNVSGIARLGSQNSRHLGILQEGMPQGPGVGPGLSTAHGVWSPNERFNPSA